MNKSQGITLGNKVNHIILIITLMFIMAFSFLNTYEVHATDYGYVSIENGNVVMKDSGDQLVAHVISKYKDVITLCLSLATLTMVLLMIKNATQLAAAGTNSNARTAAIQAILWSSIACMLLGGATTWVALFYNAGTV